MLKGRQLYSQAFYNHQPLAAYLSFIVQFVLHPKTIYQLILEHRMFVFIFSVAFDLLIIKRFRKAGVLFVVAYESTKFYLFGERFLAESLSVGPVVYLFGLTYERWSGEKIDKQDLVLGAVFAWFVIFIREPYIPVALACYILLVWNKKFDEDRRISLAILVVLSALTLLTVPFKEYFEQVFSLNLQTNAESKSLLSLQNLPVFFYPLTIILAGKTTIFRWILVGFDLFFLIGLFELLKTKKLHLIVIIWFALALANVRMVEPGTQFYEAFHMLLWYGIFIFAIAKMMNKKVAQTVFCLSIIVFVLLPGSYVYDKVNREAEFVEGYGNYVSNGFVFKTLSNPNSTIFADRIDDLLYWVTDMKPAYKYSWYFTGMPEVEKFSQAYDQMFVGYPPDFYLGYCPKETGKAMYLPKDQLRNYTQIYFSGKPTCMYVRNIALKRISKEKIEEIGRYQYSLASSN